mgnify:CR=1 FL=1
MTNIVVITGRGISRRNATVELIRRLQRADYRVTYVSEFDYADVAAHLNIPFVRLNVQKPTEYTSPDRPQAPTSIIKRSMRVVRRFLQRRTRQVQLLDQYETRQQSVHAQLADLAPDLVLVDIEMHVTMMIVHHAGYRVISLSDFQALYKRRGIPPMHHYLIPDRTLWSDLHVELAWLIYRIRKWGRFCKAWLTQAGADPRSSLAAYARRIGYDGQHSWAYYQWPYPVLFDHLPILTLNATEFDFPHDLHPNVHYAGPMIRLDRAEVMPDADAHQRLTHILTQHADSTERKLIYCTFGTFLRRDDTAFISRIIAAIAQNPDWTLIIGLGGRYAPIALGETLPANVHAFAWVPQLRVLEHADCTIMHSGPATIYECIHFDVPMLVYPFDFNDQMGYAARVAYHGLGIVSQRTDSTAMITAHIQRLLMDETFRDNRQRMRDYFQQYAHDQRAAKIIEQFVR